MKPINTLLNALIIVVAGGALIMLVLNPPPSGLLRENRELGYEIEELKEHIEMLNNHADIDRGAIPQWFKDDFNATFIGSYGIRIEDDKLNFVIITSNKRFSRLRDAIGREDCIGCDSYIDAIDWKYICPDDELSEDTE